jgi:hypothetical protein
MITVEDYSNCDSHRSYPQHVFHLNEYMQNSSPARVIGYFRKAWYDLQISNVIEALDPNHKCCEYWEARGDALSLPEQRGPSAESGGLQVRGVTAKQGSCSDSDAIDSEDDVSCSQRVQHGSLSVMGRRSERGNGVSSEHALRAMCLI